MYNKFHEEYLQIIDKNMPYKVLPKKETKPKRKPWISKAILTSVKIKNMLYKKYLQKKDVFWYERYKFYRYNINKLISKIKKKIIFVSFFNIIFKTLEVHGKELTNYSIRSQIKMRT